MREKIKKGKERKKKRRKKEKRKFIKYMIGPEKKAGNLRVVSK